VWIKQLHGDYLAHDRMAARRPGATPRWRGLAARVVRVVRLLL